MIYEIVLVIFLIYMKSTQNEKNQVPKIVNQQTILWKYQLVSLVSTTIRSWPYSLLNIQQKQWTAMI